MAFDTGMMSTIDSCPALEPNVGSQSMMFDIVESQLSDGVQKATSQHIAVG